MTFFIPRGANDYDGVVMAWNLAAAVPATWVTTVYPLLAGVGVLVLAFRPVLLPAPFAAGALMLVGAVPALVRMARFVGDDASFFALIASPFEVAWLLGVAATTILIANGHLTERQSLRRIALAAAAFYLAYLLFPTRGTSGSYSRQNGLWVPFSILSKADALSDVLTAVVGFTKFLLVPLCVQVFRGRTPARFLTTAIFLGACVHISAIPALDALGGNGRLFMVGATMAISDGLGLFALVLGAAQLERLAATAPPATTLATPAPPGVGVAAVSLEAKLVELEALHAKGLITQQERDQKRSEILARL